jgi:predicted peptidase
MNEESQQLAIQVLETAFERYSVNKRKVYLTGFSMGGLGSWELGIRFHSLFAAVVPVASTRIRSENALPLLKKTPVMIFHGTGDLYSPITLARMALKQLRAVGNGNANLVEYSKASHGGSAALAYRDPRLFKWLFEQEKP